MHWTVSSALKGKKHIVSTTTKYRLYAWRVRDHVFNIYNHVCSTLSHKLKVVIFLLDKIGGFLDHTLRLNIF